MVDPWVCCAYAGEKLAGAGDERCCGCKRRPAAAEQCGDERGAKTARQLT